MGHYEAVKFLEAVRPMGQPACRVGECYDAVLRSQIRRAENGIYRESLYAGKLNLAPETLEEEVLQNVAIIVSTPKFSVPLDRGLGLAQRSSTSRYRLRNLS